MAEQYVVICPRFIYGPLDSKTRAEKMAVEFFSQCLEDHQVVVFERAKHVIGPVSEPYAGDEGQGSAPPSDL